MVYIVTYCWTGPKLLYMGLGESKPPVAAIWLFVVYSRLGRLYIGALFRRRYIVIIFHLSSFSVDYCD